MSYESHAEPIKLGILMDWVMPDDHPKEREDNFFSFVNWTRRDWMGAGHLVARTFDPDDEHSRLVDRLGVR